MRNLEIGVGMGIGAGAKGFWFRGGWTELSTKRRGWLRDEARSSEVVGRHGGSEDAGEFFNAGFG